MSDLSCDREDPLYAMLRDGKIEDFNRAKGETCDLRACSFRASDLRGMNADGVDFGDAYFRGTDLRGVDLRKANVEGASFIHARVSGAYFPPALSATELRMSLDHGTRVRYDASR